MTDDEQRWYTVPAAVMVYADSKADALDEAASLAKHMTDNDGPQLVVSQDEELVEEVEDE